jgi:hypothetical protein
LTRHFERAKKANGEYINFKNQDIDINRTHLNYNLAPQQNQLGFIKQRCSEVQCLNRDDVNVMCCWVVTAPKGLPESDHKYFFEGVYDFLKQRYDEKNVISAFVHMDETTPHMHFAFVPVVLDNKKQIDKVSAKECVNRKDLQCFHQDLERHMLRLFGRDIGILNEATKNGNKSVEELRRGTAQEKLKKLQENISDLERIFSDKNTTLIDIYERNKDELVVKFTALERRFFGTVLTGQQLDAIRPQHGVFGTVKGVSLDDIQCLKKTALEYAKIKLEYEMLLQDYKKLYQEHEVVKKRVPSVLEQTRQVEDMERLMLLEDLVKKLPAEIVEQLIPAQSKASERFELCQ